ncbi:MAG TPA: XTP/dITP diphosphatase [Pyrinomonadaceae bacterium]
MTTSKQLLVATHNPGKVREFALLLRDVPVRLRGLVEFPQASEVEETGATFAENAALKARSYAAQTGLWTLADDSGLEVEALGGAPGVYSARYAGIGASAEQRIERLLNELAQTGDAERRARFVCVIAIFHPATAALDFFEGKCEGRIISEPRGTNGFGYDPIFVPEGYTQTFGELSDETKAHLSHRARALDAARTFLHQHLQKPT